jgi:hypothetical protein
MPGTELDESRATFLEIAKMDEHLFTLIVEVMSNPALWINDAAMQKVQVGV